MTLLFEDTGTGSGDWIKLEEDSDLFIVVSGTVSFSVDSSLNQTDVVTEVSAITASGRYGPFPKGLKYQGTIDSGTGSVKAVFVNPVG